MRRSPGAGRRPRGPCPAGASRSPPRTASSKVLSGPGLPRPPAGKGLGRRRGPGGERREMEPGSAHPGRDPAGLERRGRPTLGQPSGLPFRGPRASSSWIPEVVLLLECHSQSAPPRLSYLFICLFMGRKRFFLFGLLLPGKSSVVHGQVLTGLF